MRFFFKKTCHLIDKQLVGFSHCFFIFEMNSNGNNEDEKNEIIKRITSVSDIIE